MSAPNYENVPLLDTPHALTVEQAAAHLGYTPASFRTMMTKLNNTPHDLRTPRQPGERQRKYDLDKIDAWIKAGRPLPEHHSLPTPKPNAQTITATATHNGTNWTVTLDNTQHTVQTNNLTTAHRAAHQLAVQTTNKAPDEITIKLTPHMPTQTAQKWDQAKAKKTEAQKAQALAAKLSVQVVKDLQAQGCNLEDIGELLHMTKQRAQQLASSPVEVES